MLYPIDKDNEMKWSFAPMVEIPEEERKKYPNPNIPGKFYERKIDTENSEIHDEFIMAMSNINELMKNQQENK